MGGRYRIELDHESVHAGEHISGQIVVTDHFDAQFFTLTLWNVADDHGQMERGPSIQIPMKGAMSPGDSFRFTLWVPLTVVPSFTGQKVDNGWMLLGLISGIFFQGAPMASIWVLPPRGELPLADRVDASFRSDLYRTWIREEKKQETFGFTGLVFDLSVVWAFLGFFFFFLSRSTDPDLAGLDDHFWWPNVIWVPGFFYTRSAVGRFYSTFRERSRTIDGLSLAVDQTVLDGGEQLVAQVVNPDSVACMIGLRCIEWYIVSSEGGSHAESHVVYEDWRPADSMMSVNRFEVPSGPPSFKLGLCAIQWEVRIAHGTAEDLELHHGVAEHLVVVSREMGRPPALSSSKEGTAITLKNGEKLEVGGVFAAKLSQKRRGKENAASRSDS